VNNTCNELLECVTIDGVRAHQSVLQSIADANGGTRVSGTPGYNESAEYVASQMEDAGYDVTMQQFQHPAFIQLGPSVLEQLSPVPTTYIEGFDHALPSQTDPGDVTALVTAVDLQLGSGNASTSGCEAADFAAFPAGHIALIQRGACSYQLKAENAAAAGAVGAIIFNQGNTNDRLGMVNGTVGVGYSGGIPVLFSTYSLGEQWSMTAGLELRMVVDVFRGTATSYNVLAETTTGDPNNTIMVGAHLDSVNQGPGIQDNGSGSAAILETAVQMARVEPRNKVRFAWWGAEESGLLGSTHYVSNLSQEELDQITLYLNFDMIGSPNYVFSIYDGDDSDGIGAGPGPDGSAQIEQTFELYYLMLGEPFKGTDFSGRSDYRPFIEVGIPSGGLFTGAEGIKTHDEVGLWGGTAGEQYDPCYHRACDTFDNISLKSLDVNSDAVAYATLKYAMDTSDVISVKGKGNFVWKNKDTEYLGPLAIQ
jgi:aminopeptidase Y